MDAETKQALDAIANAMQAITVLSTRLRRTLGESAQDAIELEGAADRGVRALKQLQPKPRSDE